MSIEGFKAANDNFPLKEKVEDVHRSMFNEYVSDFLKPSDENNPIELLKSIVDDVIARRNIPDRSDTSIQSKIYNTLNNLWVLTDPDKDINDRFHKITNPAAQVTNLKNFIKEFKEENPGNVVGMHQDGKYPDRVIFQQSVENALKNQPEDRVTQVREIMRHVLAGTQMEISGEDKFGMQIENHLHAAYDYINARPGLSNEEKAEQVEGMLQVVLTSERFADAKAEHSENYAVPTAGKPKTDDQVLSTS